jgi:hypothetical protein
LEDSSEGNLSFTRNTKFKFIVARSKKVE